jgi:hypothetical protein
MEKNNNLFKCDQTGCELICCKGCSCCITKSETIRNKDKEINKLKFKLFELITRPISIGSNEQHIQDKEQLSQENNRLRTERNAHYQQAQAFYQENKELKSKLQKQEQKEKQILELVIENDNLITTLQTTITNLENKLLIMEEKGEKIANQVHVLLKK